MFRIFQKKKEDSSPAITLIAGLGNPGEHYERTRHNAGFMAVDALASTFQFPIFDFQSKFNTRTSQESIGHHKVVLAKPQTFMNRSGDAIQSITRFYKIPPAHTIVIHDDIDLPLGTMKIVQGRGAGGHRGVQSIIERLGTNDFIRIRIGIIPASGKPSNPEQFVLGRFTKEEAEHLEHALQKTSQAVEAILQEGIAMAISRQS